MNKGLLFFLLIFFTLSLQAQKDSTNLFASSFQNDGSKGGAEPKINIYPVPVRGNKFTIKTDKDISFVKITNIIGQDIFRAQYNNPQQFIPITLDNPRRGIYLVTIIFSDSNRVVKKIMVEESD
jgi:hypothetical protein